MGLTANTLNTIMSSNKALLNTLHLFSPSLPIGTFAFSQGLESAIESNHIADATALEVWCESVLRNSLQTLDCHYLRQAYQTQSAAEWVDVNSQMLAFRETAELLQEDLLLGSALKKWTEDQGIDFPSSNEYSVVAL